MLLQLDQARNGPLRWRDAVAVAASDLLRDEALVPTGVDCEGSLTFTDPDFLLQARLRYRHRLRCDRCLAAFEEDVDLPVVFVVIAAEEAAAVSEGEEEPATAQLDADDLSTLAASDGAVDLTRLVCEQVDLNVPMKPTCSRKCKGLCASCGVDRNREACTCAADAVDPRWQGLEALRERFAAADAATDNVS